MDPILGIDYTKVELLDQILLDLEDSFSSAPAGVTELVTGVTSAVHCLRNGLKFKFSEHVAQLTREGKQQEALRALHEFFPHLGLTNVEEILKLIYVGGDADNLRVAIEFVEVLEGDEMRWNSFKVLYQDVCFKGHTTKPEMLMLQKCLTGGGEDLKETLTQVDEDCVKIVDRIVEEIKTKKYTLSTYVVKNLGRELLDGKIVSIVKKVHADGTVQDTLLLIAFSQQLEIFSCCTLNPSSF